MTNKISNAPAPITPLRGVSSYNHKPPTIPPADYETWCKADLWTIERGILLLLKVEAIPYGRTPDEKSFYKAFEDDFNKMLAIAKSSVQVGKLRIQGKGFRKLSEVLPSDFVAWARSKDYQIPIELEVIGSMVQAETVANVSAATVIPNTESKPWLIVEARDPKPEYQWYIPARYFARQLVAKDSTLLTKHNILAEKVVQSLTKAGFKKRGGKLPFNPATVLKALSNVVLS